MSYMIFFDLAFPYNVVCLGLHSLSLKISTFFLMTIKYYIIWITALY